MANDNKIKVGFTTFNKAAVATETLADFLKGHESLGLSEQELTDVWNQCQPAKAEPAKPTAKAKDADKA